jgi:glycosyltransferase involved in cell wall biosynthesis
MLGLPIIATGQQGVAETLGSSALVLHGASEELVAVAVRRVLFDPDVRDTLVARQREHFSTRYSSDVIQPAFLAAVEQCLSLGAGVAIPA